MSRVGTYAELTVTEVPEPAIYGCGTAIAGVHEVNRLVDLRRGGVKRERGSRQITHVPRHQDPGCRVATVNGGYGQGYDVQTRGLIGMNRGGTSADLTVTEVPEPANDGSRTAIWAEGREDTVTVWFTNPGLLNPPHRRAGRPAMARLITCPSQRAMPPRLEIEDPSLL